ncbi:MAG: DUF4956 domain-containing protein [Pseudomonadales bacterium]
MRKSSRVSAPLLVMTVYYGIAIAVFQLTIYLFPGIGPYLPIGGIEALIGRGADTFQQMEIMGSTIFDETTPSRLGIAIVSGTILMIPISWVYFITTPDDQVDRSFAQTMLILPIIVAGIATIVQNSIALAFSLAGVVAAVRFRFTLSQPAHTLYIFSAITIGLGSGISAVGVSTIISIGFVYTTLALWRLDYGKNLNTPFYAFLTGRDYRKEDD